MLIINRKGIFGLSSYKYVQEYSRFAANGSGGEFALGAMFAVFGEASNSAADVAEVGVRAGSEFDDGSALPMQLLEVDLIDS
jgi:ATP-dependent protease HslVU (ClpYQ) peptidase subunit